MPANPTLRIVEMRRRFGKVAHPSLGVTMEPFVIDIDDFVGWRAVLRFMAVRATRMPRSEYVAAKLSLKHPKSWRHDRCPPQKPVDSTIYNDSFGRCHAATGPGGGAASLQGRPWAREIHEPEGTGARTLRLSLCDANGRRAYCQGTNPDIYNGQVMPGMGHWEIVSAECRQ